ncbi:MAG: hypothetical protein H6625_00630 [Bdellovibrionaceae bacterium]|nr:hypothetical protein [Pseudobdellovibrionaceae bacterium]
MKAAKIYLSLIVIIFSEIIYASQVCYPIRMSTPDGGMIETQACYNLPDPASIPSIKFPETRIPEIHIPDIYSGRAMEINRQLSRLDNLPKLPDLPKIPEFYNIPNKLNIDVDKLITISNQQFGIPAESPEEFIESLKKAGAKIDLEKIKSWEIIISSYKKIIPLEKEKIKKAKEDIKNLTDGLQKVTAVHLLASTREIDDTRSEIDSKLVGSTNNLIKKSNDREDKNKIVIRSEFGEEEIIVWESNQSKELKEAYSELSKINPKTDVEFELKNTGLKSFRLADESYRDGDSEAGDFYKNIGLSVIDALVGWDMVTGTVRDTYEAVTGKNLIT